LQAVPKPFHDLPQVPLAISLAKTEEARQLIELGIHSPSIFARPFVVPPGTPKDRLEILERAFQETLKDKEFLAEAEKAKLDIDPVTSSELQKSVAGIFKLNAALVAKLNDILFK
jgi:tripartite-type tricarboxylate transporter receptor subunit TctC